MIKIRLSDLLGKHKMTQKALSEITGIRPATISKMYYEEVKRIDVRHLNNICKAFNCEISELLEYIPDKKEIKKQTEKIKYLSVYFYITVILLFDLKTQIS